MSSEPDGISRDCVIIARPEELIIRLRGLSRRNGLALVGLLFPVLLGLLWFKDFGWPYVLLSVLLAYVGLFIGLTWTQLKVTRDGLVTSAGPVPFFGTRARLVAVQVHAVSTELVRTPLARGGTSERYSVRAQSHPDDRTLTLLDTASEKDARAAALALWSWLNAHRAAGAPPVTLSG